jgi:hypothetical protein
LFFVDRWRKLGSSQVFASMTQSQHTPTRRRQLAERDAIDIWIARWLRLPRKHLLQRYDCDPRRLYEIWEEVRFAGSRAKALLEFHARFPGLTDRVDYGPHRRIPRKLAEDLQLRLFD